MKVTQLLNTESFKRINENIQVMSMDEFLASAGAQEDEVDEGSVTHFKGGLRHHGDYGTEFQPDDARDEYGHRTAPPHVAGAKRRSVNGPDSAGKIGRGRPVKSDGMSTKSLPADPFGRTTGAIPKGTPGKQHINVGREVDESNGVATANVARQWAQAYHKIAPTIEKYKDSDGANALFKTLENIALHNGATEQFTKMMRGARNNAHQDYDTNPGGFENWFWFIEPWLETASTEVRESKVSSIIKGIFEATALPAQQRELGGQEFQDYMTRIAGTPDIDKKTGQVKVDKKGIEKYVSGKTKTDKYKMPYMHRSSVITYYDEANKKYREEDVVNALKERPKKLLKQNEKMKHSNGELEQFFNVGFAALTGIAVDESTGKLVVVNTCPGAGSCKVDCFAMKGGKVQFKNAWVSDGKILTYLLNDPDGFFAQLSAEISKEEKLGQKGGYSVTIRWHDAGDFFSPEYLDMALKMAAAHPTTKFYAYTKMAGAALAQKPPNFIINWSEGANTQQEKQVKASDPNLERTKNSRIVPEKLFWDLLAKDQKGNLVKGPDGQWQVAGPEQLKVLKQRLAHAYNISPNSILSYDEYQTKATVGGMKYNVIVAPGEGDVSANDPNVLSTLLLRH